jgi:hypothetical protein
MLVGFNIVLWGWVLAMHGQPEEGWAQIHGELSTHSLLCHVACCVMHDLLYCATYPSSTVMVYPMTNEAASEQSQMTVAGTSSGFSIRPTGSLASISAIRSGSCIIRQLISSNKEGERYVWDTAQVTLPSRAA